MPSRWLTLVMVGLTLLPTTILGQERPKQPILDPIAPFLDAQTIAVGHLDVRKVDVAAAMEFFAKDIPAEMLPPAQRAEAVAKGTEFRDKLLKAGCNDIYLIVNLDDFPHSMPLIVFSLAKDGKPKLVQEVLTAAGPNAEGELLHGAYVVAQAETRQRLKTLKPVPRPDLAKALQAAGDATAQFVVSAPDDTRRVIRETLPALPPELGGASGADLAEGFQWLAAGMNLPPKMSLQVTLQAKDAKAAAQFHSIAAKGLDLLAKSEEVQRELPPIKGLAPLLIPKVQEDRLVLKIDEQEGNLTKIIDELVKPAVASARGAAQRATSANNLKQLMIGMHMHHDTYKKFPAQASRGKDGKKLLSWRVYLLPFLEQKELFDQFHFDEPWDSEHNKKLIEKMPPVFVSPTLPVEMVKKGMTTYLVPVGPKTVFEGEEGISLSKITDGTSQTIAIVEVAPEHAVVWTKPDDWNVDFSNPWKGLMGKPAADKSKQPAGFNAAFCDGSIHFIADSVAAETLRRLLQKDDGEPLGDF